MLWELTHRKQPTFELSKETAKKMEKAEEIYQPKIEQETFKELIESCWKEKPKERVSIYKIMSILDSMLKNNTVSLSPSLVPSNNSTSHSSDEFTQFSFNDIWKINYDELDGWDLVAETNFSTVYKGKYKNLDVAIKTLEISYTGEKTLTQFE